MVSEDERLTRHLPELRACAQRMTRSAEDAEDLVQDCLASALPGLDRLRRPEALGAWLLQILRRRWYDLLRRRALERKGLSDEAASPAPSGDPEGVRRALRELDAEDRRILELRFFKSQTSVQIAAALGKPAGTVRSMIFHALRKFEAAYAKEDP